MAANTDSNPSTERVEVEWGNCKNPLCKREVKKKNLDVRNGFCYTCEQKEQQKKSVSSIITSADQLEYTRPPSKEWARCPGCLNELRTKSLLNRPGFLCFRCLVNPKNAAIVNAAVVATKTGLMDDEVRAYCKECQKRFATIDGLCYVCNDTKESQHRYCNTKLEALQAQLDRAVQHSEESEGLMKALLKEQQDMVSERDAKIIKLEEEREIFLDIIKMMKAALQKQ